jgi:phosphoribosyl-AMP cyclohydrolase / phosphoribosyl-ATP pyrophosphohydrolase
MEAERALTTDDLDTLDFGKGVGLLPAIIQHAHTGAVLMLGFMDREALEATLARRRVVFFSRSKGRLWEKGETSGHNLEVAAIRPDCDRDALLITAVPRGPTCHLGNTSCFGSEPTSATPSPTFLAELESIIADRIGTRPEGSYTAELIASGMTRVAQKVGEEALELALAAAADTDHEVIAESADLLYHLLVLLNARGLTLDRVLTELRIRHIPRHPKVPAPWRDPFPVPDSEG